MVSCETSYGSLPVHVPKPHGTRRKIFAAVLGGLVLTSMIVGFRFTAVTYGEVPRATSFNDGPFARCNS